MQLIQNIQREVFLILDSLKVHHAKFFRDYLAAQVEYLEVFYLTSYSPEFKSRVRERLPESSRDFSGAGRNKWQLKKDTSTSSGNSLCHLAEPRNPLMRARQT